jgi:DNA mismatch endonuclease (patch repair protein)
MQSNRGRDTGPELRLRSALHAQGFRFRVNYPLTVSARVRVDIVFTRRRLAVFIDGCFWHGCTAHRTLPKSNIEFWSAKISANRERDEKVDAMLLRGGWRVLRIWEHVPLQLAVAMVASALREL